MMKRRSFLVGGSSLALSQLLSGCNRQQRASLNLQLLKGSIPPQMLKEFRKDLKPPVQLNFAPEEQLNNLFKRLETWQQQAKNKNSQQRWSIPFIGKKTPPLADLVTLGDYWLESAIKQGLIKPLEIEDLAGWKTLPSRLQELVKRDNQGQFKKNGQVWGAPYRWGTTVIAYRRDKFKELGWTPKDWSDLWRPELQGHISLLDQPREVIGLTLKKLGKSYNTEKLSEVQNLEEELSKLHQQVKYYSSNKYLEPLILGDTWLALGWSTDVLSVRSSNRQIEAIVPLSGTAIWADVWVQPASVSDNSKPPAGAKANTSLTKDWINFCWQPQSSEKISILSNATSPIFFDDDSKTLPKALQDNPLLLPDSSVLDKSEFLKPLPKEVSQEYEALWKKIRDVRHS